MDVTPWSKEKEDRFAKELENLLATFNIAHLSNFHAGTIGGHFEMTGNYYYWKPEANDGRDAEEAIHNVLIDQALDNGDREMFDRLTITLCADCDRKLEDVKYACHGCGKPMCATCYTCGNGKCAECKYPNSRRYI